jgi:hypothetical protein
MDHGGEQVKAREAFGKFEAFVIANPRAASIGWAICFIGWVVSGLCFVAK